MTEPVKAVRDYRSWVAIVALLVASAGFAVIAATVATRDPILQRDMQVLVWLHTHGSPVFTGFLLAITQLHSMIGVCVFTLILAVVLARRKKWYWVLALALAMGGGLLLNAILKLIFQRNRPVWDDPLITLTSNSFPSGHAAGATLFYGFFTVYVVSHVKELSLRAICVVISALMVALVAFSRMYLGVHYLSDVLAAISISTAWLVICLWGVRKYSSHQRAA